MEGQPGVMLGEKYRFTERLGRFAAVELSSAVDTTTGRAVSLQRLPLSAALPDAVQKLQARITAVQPVRQDNLLAVLDSFEAAGALYVVTESVSGESLAARLTREAVTVSQLSSWLAAAMRAVVTLHRHGVVLGAVHPAAIYLTGSDATALPVVKVVPLLLGSLCALPVTDPQVGYCSMEQLAGATDLDARADVYAFAAIAYRALTGWLPFEADSAAATRLRIMTEAPTPLKRLRADLPDELCTLLDLALAKRREERLSSLDSVLALLEPCAEQIGRRKLQLMTVQLPPERAEAPRALVASGPEAQAAQGLAVTLLASAVQQGLAPTNAAAAQSSLQPVDRPARSALPQPSAAGATASLGLLARRGPQLALGALALLLIAGWAFSQRGRTSSLATQAPRIAELTPSVASPASAARKPEPSTAANGLATSAAAGAGTPATEAEPQVQPRADKPDAAKRGTRARKRAAAAAPATSATPEKTRPECSPNYVFDAQGVKHWKPECF